MIKNRHFILLIAFLLMLQPLRAAQDDDLLATMTLEQKVGQMFLVHLYGDALGFAGREMLTTWQPGGVVLFGSNITTPENITWLINSYQQTITDAGGVPLFVATDQEGGWIARLRDGFTEWPPMSLTAATNDEALARRVGEHMGLELRAVGVNMNLAPVADLDTNIDNPIIGRRSPGSNPQTVGAFLRGYIAGLRDAQVIATTKHFPGHGDTTEDSHLTLPVIDHDYDRLDQVELVPFREAIAAETGAVMVAHIWFSRIDPGEPLPSSLSRNVITGILRENLGYDGLVMTDALDMDAIDTTYTPGEAAVMAVNAGVDLLAYGPGMGEARQMEAMQAVVDAIRNGDIPESRIDASVRRILRTKADYGVMDWTPLEPATVHDRIDIAGTAPLVEEIFDAGVTIAYDMADLLPIADDQTVGIVYPAQRISISRECGALRDDIRWVGVTDFPTQAEINTAVSMAAQVDTVIVFSRNIRENDAYQALVNALPLDRAVGVALRTPYDVVTYPEIAAYVLTYGPQDPAIPAVCGILFGAQPDLGTLTVNLP